MDGEFSTFGPILIGPTLSKNPILDVENLACYSVDMLRFRLTYRADDFENLQKALDKYMCKGNLETYSNSGKVGGYRFMWVWRYKDAKPKKPEASTAIALGWGHVGGTSKINLGSGFLEYNPNKLYDSGEKLINYLQGFGVKFEPVRYDLAIDYPIKRDTVRMVKDGRNYECCISDSITEYLGQRSKPGRVKVYDKAAETGLAADLTRIELTVQADWKKAEIMAQLPKVYSYENVEMGNLKGVTKAFAIALQALSKNGDIAEPWLRLVDAKTRTKLRKTFSQNAAVQYSDMCIERIIQKVNNWV